MLLAFTNVLALIRPVPQSATFAHPRSYFTHESNSSGPTNQHDLSEISVPISGARNDAKNRGWQWTLKNL